VRWPTLAVLVVCACKPDPGTSSTDPTSASTSDSAAPAGISCEERLKAPTEQGIEDAAETDPACADAMRLALATDRLQLKEPDDAALREALGYCSAVITANASYPERMDNVTQAAESILDVPPLSDDVSVETKAGRVADLIALHDQLRGRQPDVDACILEVALAQAREVGDEQTLQVLRSNLVDVYIELADFDPEGGVAQLQEAKRLLEELLASEVRKDLHETAREQLEHVEQRLGG
jgi:hypothetical protein